MNGQPLHSTVVLLKAWVENPQEELVRPLHSTVVLLKEGDTLDLSEVIDIFTFYCSSIKRNLLISPETAGI